MNTQTLPFRLNLRHARQLALASVVLSLVACGGGGGSGKGAAVSTCDTLAKLVTTARSLGTIAGFESAMDLLVGPDADSASTCQIEAAMDAMVI